MTNPHGLLPIADDAPIEGHDAMALPVHDKLESVESLLEMAQIPVVTQESQNANYFHNRLWHLQLISKLILWPLSYLYLFDTHPSITRFKSTTIPFHYTVVPFAKSLSKCAKVS
jgi:hypothetical protein